MTDTAKRLIDELERELEKLPEAEQEEFVVLCLQDLRHRNQQNEKDQAHPEGDTLYKPFQMMLDADLDFPSDYSETYEDHLYGDPEQDD